MTSSTAIFWPVLAQVLLTYAIYVIMSSRRIGAVKAGLAKPSDFKVPSIEPEPSATAARNLSNQFELPVLFFAASLSLFVTGGAGLAAVVVAWAFVLARVAHCYVHITSNRIRIRGNCSPSACCSISCSGCCSPFTFPDLEDRQYATRRGWRRYPGDLSDPCAKPRRKRPTSVCLPNPPA